MTRSTRLRVPKSSTDTPHTFKVDFTIDNVPGIPLKDAVKDIRGLGLDGANDLVFNSFGDRQIKIQHEVRHILLLFLF